MQTTDKHHKKDLKPRIKDKTLPGETIKYSECLERLIKQINHYEIRYIKEYKFKPGRHWRYDFYLLDARALIEIEGGPWSSNRKKNHSHATRKRRNVHPDRGLDYWDNDRMNAAVESGFTVYSFTNPDVMTNSAIRTILEIFKEKQHE